MKRLDRYADYEEMDEYPTIACVLGGYSEDATPRTPKTPLQQFTEEVWDGAEETDLRNRIEATRIAGKIRALCQQSMALIRSPWARPRKDPKAGQNTATGIH